MRANLGSGSGTSPSALRNPHVVQSTKYNLQPMQHVFPPETARRPLMSTGAAAALAACHRSTVVRAIRAGELEAVRLGRSGDFRIAPEALGEWLRPAHNPEETL